MNWLIRAALVILYPRTPNLPGVEDCDIDGFLVKFRRETPTLMWVGTVLGAIVFHLTPVMTVFIPLPAFLLPKKLADTHAHKITTTNFYLLRQAIFLVKLPGGMAWGANAEVRKRFAMLPYDPDPGTWRTE